MAPPIYFFPRVRPAAVVDGNRLRASFLEGVGAAPAFVGVRDARLEASCFEITGKGPGGHSGTMLTVINPKRDAPARLGFYPTHQTWHERPAGCDLWLGIDRDDPPTPADLAHVERPEGHEVTLGDGHSWRVLIVRSPMDREALGRSQLTREFVYDAQGRFQVVRAAATDALWELSAEAWDHFFDQEKHPTIKLETMTELVLMTLAQSYRVGRIEQTVLRLVNSTNWDDAVAALLDLPLIDEYERSQKKTAASATES